MRGIWVEIAVAGGAAGELRTAKGQPERFLHASAPATAGVARWITTNSLTPSVKRIVAEFVGSDGRLS